MLFLKTDLNNNSQSLASTSAEYTTVLFSSLYTHILTFYVISPTFIDLNNIFLLWPPKFIFFSLDFFPDFQMHISICLLNISTSLLVLHSEIGQSTHREKCILHISTTVNWIQKLSYKVIEKLWSKRGNGEAVQRSTVGSYHSQSWKNKGRHGALCTQRKLGHEEP